MRVLVCFRSVYHLAALALAKAARTAEVYKEQHFSDHARVCIDYDCRS